MTERRTNERTNEHTNERTYEVTNGGTEKRKLYTPTYFVCRGYKNIGSWNPVIPTNKALSDFPVGKYFKSNWADKRK